MPIYLKGKKVSGLVGWARLVATQNTAKLKKNGIDCTNVEDSLYALSNAKPLEVDAATYESWSDAEKEAYDGIVLTDGDDAEWDASMIKYGDGSVADALGKCITSNTELKCLFQHYSKESSGSYDAVFVYPNEYLISRYSIKGVLALCENKGEVMSSYVNPNNGVITIGVNERSTIYDFNLIIFY